MARNRTKFARLITGAVNGLAGFEGKSTRAIEEELGAAIGRTYNAIQNYKAERAMPDDPAAVRIMATALVRRGYLTAAWLKQFAEAAGYPDGPGLVAELFGSGAPHEAISGPQLDLAEWCDNLGAAPYSRFVQRRQPLLDLLDGLRKDKIIILLSLGGMGKSSLAYQIAARCRDQFTGQSSAGRLPGALPDLDAAVWVSDKHRPGSTTLPVVLDSLLRTLGYDGATGYEHQRKLNEVQALLRRRRLLLIIDNFETVTDPELLDWLLALPERCRALLTTRERRPAFLDHGLRVIELDGMAEGEARQLIADRAAKIGLPGTIGPAEERELLALTGGSPLAIQLLLGYLKSTGQTAHQAAVSFSALAQNLLPSLFAHCWAQIGPAAQALLLAASLFREGATRPMLAEVVDMPPDALDQAMAQLIDHALLEVEEDAQHPAAPLRYGLHPLTRRFGEAHHAAHAAAVAQARERWLGWAARYAEGFGYLLHNVAQLNQLDADRRTLADALAWAVEQGRHQSVIRMARGLEFFFYVRGDWGEKLKLHLHYIAAAAQLGDRDEQIYALTMHIQLLCRLQLPAQAEPFLGTLSALADPALLAGQPAFHIQHSWGLYHLARGEHGPAEASWRQILDHAGAWQLPDHMQIGALHWLGVCRLRQGRPAEARPLFLQSLDQARAGGYRRWVARNQLQLAQIATGLQQPAEASERLAESRDCTEASDREQLAHLQRAQARLYQAAGKRFEAQAAMQEARELFERMGLGHELGDDDRAILGNIAW